jgi:FKBP12-rapamycin complex-associated protein
MGASSELIRVAILWLEMWHEGLEDASRLHFGEGNVSGMLDLLLPLHEKLEKWSGDSERNEFVKSFGSDLAEAHNFVKEYIRIVTSDGGSVPTQGGGSDQAIQLDRSGNPARQSKEAETAINKAWDIYYQVFRWINKQLPGLTKLELHQCSPAL